MKKMQKIFSVLMMVMTIVMFATTMVSAVAAPNPNTYTGDISADVTGITSIGNQIVTIISTVGSIASVIVLVILGLKYMIGSAEEKAEYKKTLMPYIIGACLVFAASAIAGIIFGFAETLGTAA